MKFKDIIFESNREKIKKKKSLESSEKFRKVMKEFYNKELYSSSGKLVTDKKQAIAIAYSESENE